MSQTSQLIKTLKRFLKSKGMTYRTLAAHLNLSEASIKRLFSQQTFSLKRLEEICSVLNINISDLVKMSDREKEEPLLDFLSMEQERQLAANSKQLMVFYLLVNGWTPPEIVESFTISETEATGIMLALDRLQLIELHPDNKFRLLTSRNFSWRKGGPVWEAYKDQVQQEFFDSDFNNTHERLDLYTGELSLASLQIFNRKVDRLLREFNELAEIDSTLPTAERHAFGVIIGLRPWVFSLLAALKRQHEKKVG